MKDFKDRATLLKSAFLLFIKESRKHSGSLWKREARRDF